MRPALLLLPLAGTMLVPTACGPSAGPRRPVPGVSGRIADFRLLDQDGSERTREDLRERFWIADFFFTRCPTVCPRMTRVMAQLAGEYRHEPRVGFVSLSVDPEFDTPEVLRRYAAARRLDLRRWLLLTGSREAIRSLSLDSFRLGLAEDMDENGDITHSTRFVLLDPEGRIRGYYLALEGGGLEELRGDLDALLAAGAGAAEGRKP